MAGHGQKLSRKQESAIAALLSEPTVARAAAKAGVSPRALKGWLSLPGFQCAFREARRRVVDGAVAQMQRATGAAVRALRRNLTAEKASDQIRAAQIILEGSIKAVELTNLVERIEDLERALLERGSHDDSNPDAAGGAVGDSPGPADGHPHAAVGPAPAGPGAGDDGRGPDPRSLASPAPPLFAPPAADAV
jgi:hypothetical protein